MTPLRSALSWHLGQNAIHLAAQVDVFVEQGRHNLGRGPVHESLRACRRPCLVPSRSPVIGEGRNVARATLSAGRGLYPYVRGQRLGRLHEFVPSEAQSQQATFPWTSMIRCAFSSSFSRRVFSRSSLRTFPSSGFRSLGFRPRLFTALSATQHRLAPCRQVRGRDDADTRPRSRRSSPRPPVPAMT